MGADMEAPSREQVPQLLLPITASEAAETTASPSAARVGFRRPSSTGPGLVKVAGTLAEAPCPRAPTVSTLLASAGVPTEMGAGQNSPAFPAAATRRRSGCAHMARSASRAKES